MSFKKNTQIVFYLIFSIVLFSCYSCGSKRSGGDEEVNFILSDLIGKYWYSNVWLDSPDGYDVNDGLQVLRFEYDGILKYQEYSGKRDTVIGTWEMIGNELTIRDNRIGENHEQRWYIVAPSKSTYLKLSSDIGSKEYYAELADLEGLSADARIINEYYLANGYQEGYRYEFELRGNDIKQAKALLNDGSSYNLEQAAEGTWRLNAEDASTHFDTFTGKEKIRFYVEFNSGFEVKLDEYIYAKKIEKLDYRDITVTHASGSSEIEINWKAFEEDEILYQVEILDKTRDEANPVFVSNIQPAGKEQLIINSEIGFFVNELHTLVVGEEFYVKVVAFCYEPGIDIVNGKDKDINIQAKSQFILKQGAW